jgi:23S rRNA pseudouridine1911/1915/1917 synthase
VSEGRIEFHVDDAEGRIDKYLAARLGEVSRSEIQRLIAGGEVTVNGEQAKASYKVQRGDRIVLFVPATQDPDLVAEPIPLDVVYEDEYLLVVDKPPGMVVHPAPGHAGGTLVNALLARYPELASAGGDRPGIVHRLDRDTSGLILVSRSEKIRRALQRQFKEREVHKVYLALVLGLVQPSWARIEAPIGRDPVHRQRMAVVHGGREAVTEYHVLETFSHPVGPAAGDYTLVRAEPHTGRTHQIRVHLASIGHPLVGDPVYGPRRRTHLPLARHFLHAEQIGFRHPVSGIRIQLEAPLPPDLARVLGLLRSGELPRT